MKQVDFETALKALKVKNSAAIVAMKNQLMELKEKEKAIGRRIAADREECSKLKHQRIIIAKAMEEMIDDRRAEIDEFIRLNGSGVTSNLGDVSDWALFRELNRRGFTGSVENAGKPEDFIATCNLYLRGGGISEE